MWRVPVSYTHLVIFLFIQSRILHQGRQTFIERELFRIQISVSYTHLVSLNATLSGQGDIAIGNIVGSNIFNIGVILGVSATICPLQVKKQLLRIDIPVMLAATVLFTILFWNGTLGRTEGLFFLTGIIIYTIFSLFYSRKHGTEGSSQELEEQPKHWAVDTLAIVGGLVVLVFASRLLVDNAVSIAKELGVSEAVIGLTIVAAGTSMPELATSIVAAYKRKTDIAIGNRCV